MEQVIFLSQRQNEAYPSLVRDAISLIEANYAFLYGIDELADQLEVTKPHLIRLFTAGTGISPGQYLIHIRMYHARSMLLSGLDTPLEIIAGACGYSNANYFCKAFKKETGMPPSEYRKVFGSASKSVHPDPIIQKLYL
ncbi:MAG: AraC family transcriptional regulator [Bacillota bacterium]|nr:AraC family transcriptional regulator [Bacillota bacterium]